MLRIIGGELRGRRLVQPKKETIRPTSHKVREAVFDILGARIDLYKIRFLDLYAGSGAVGLEAISRGAEFVEFVESDPDAIRAIRRNAETLGAQEKIEITRGGRSETGVLPRHREFDVIFADPPYATEDLNFEPLCELLRGSGYFIFESAHGTEILPPGMELEREYRYGKTKLRLFRRVSHGSLSAMTRK